MSKAAAVDFETVYSDECSVTTLGNQAYTLHPDFEAYMVSIYSPDYEFVGDPWQADWHKIKDLVWLSHNAGFDQAVYHRLKTLLISRPKNKAIFLPSPKLWHCTASLAAYLGAPRNLGGAVKYLLGHDVDKGMRNWMKGKGWADAVAAGKDKDLLQYAAKDAKYCYQLWENHGSKWPEHEQILSDLTYKKGAQGLHIDSQELKKGIKTLKNEVFKAELQIPWVKDGEPPTSIKSLRAACLKAGIEAPASTSEDDERCQQWEDKYSGTYNWVQGMRNWRKTNRLLKILETMDRRTVNNSISYSLKYFGAHTGRWSGDAGFNVQNLHKGDSFGIDIRKLLRARAGKKFIICDLSQIEPRVLAWISGDTRMLEALKNGFGIYEAHARNTMNWTGGNLKKENPELYALAKARVLGLGYGCGKDKFILVAKNLANIELSLEESTKIVKEFRATNPCITNLWGRLEIAFRRASTGAEPRIFELELPSGRVMRYLNVTSKMGYQAQNILGGPLRFFWGGSLTENLVQATARDIFAQGLLNLEQAGVNCVMHVHDEYICEVDQCVKPEAIVELVTRCPDWISGLPIAAEAFESDHYTK